MTGKLELAAEARNLKENEAFQRALDAIRSRAVEVMVNADATDIESIRNMQAQVRVVDALRDGVEDLIALGAPVKTAGLP